MDVIRSFHGYGAPGVLIGGVMVDLAVRNVPADTLCNAVCETAFCLPDAVQVLTGCTVGNGHLQVFNWGRYAMTLCARDTHEGVRVFLDGRKLDPFDELKAWYLKLKTKPEQNLERLIGQIREAGHSVMGMRKVRIDPKLIVRPHKGQIAFCPLCGVTYPESDGPICLACRERAPYLLES